jgi:hypothetical protein
MDDQTNPTYPEYYTKFDVTVLDGESVLNEVTYFGDTGTKWQYKLVDLPAVDDLKVCSFVLGYPLILTSVYVLSVKASCSCRFFQVEITGYYGWNTLGLDDLIILPTTCGRSYISSSNICDILIHFPF